MRGAAAWPQNPAPGTRVKRYAFDMCRNIRPLFNFEPPATDAEVQAAALQYVRKVSGTRKPSGAALRLLAVAKHHPEALQAA